MCSSHFVHIEKLILCAAQYNAYNSQNVQFWTLLITYTWILLKVKNMIKKYVCEENEDLGKN